MTIQAYHYILTLPLNIRVKILNYSFHHGKSHFLFASCASMLDALYFSFDWEKTTEGYDFWDKFYFNSYGSRKYDPKIKHEMFDRKLF